MKTDLRVVKTHQSIRHALIFLLIDENRRFDDIGIQEILQTAMVNRATFYKYYAGKKDLARQMIADFKADYAARLQQRMETTDLTAFLQENLLQLFDRRRLLLALWKIDTDRLHLYRDMQQMIEQTFLRLAEQNAVAATPYQAALAATVILTTVKYYFEQQRPVPFKQIAADWQLVTELVFWQGERRK